MRPPSPASNYFASCDATSGSTGVPSAFTASSAGQTLAGASRRMIEELGPHHRNSLPFTVYRRPTGHNAFLQDCSRMAG
jgi:hypothetical protein